MIKVCLTLLLSLIYTFANCQIDLKNSLSDLKTKFTTEKNSTKKIQLAISIGSFYLTNKVFSKSTIDSADEYASKAGKLSKEYQFQKGMQDAEILKARILLFKGRTMDVKEMIEGSAGTFRCRLLMLYGCYFLEKPGEDTTDLDTADRNFGSAEKYANAQRMPNLTLMAMAYHYKLMLERKDDQKKCDSYLSMLLSVCRTMHNTTMYAKILSIKAVYEMYDKRSVIGLKQTIIAARAAKDDDLEMRCMKDLADFNLQQGQVDSAEMQLKKLNQLYLLKGYKNLQYTHDLLAAVYTSKGNYETAMRYGLSAVKYAEESGTEPGLNYIYYRLANICRDMGIKRESIQWYQKCLDETIRLENRFPFLVFKVLATQMIAEGKASLVLQKVKRAEKRFPFNPASSIYISSVKAECYLALKRNDIAESYYKKLIVDFNKTSVKTAYYYSAYKDVAAFYIQQQQFGKANAYVDTLLSATKGLVTVTDQAMIEYFKFKIDSARGSYQTAIKHFENSKTITDSIFNHIRLRQTEQLQLQYTTSRRDKENLMLRNRNIIQNNELENEGEKRRIVSFGLMASIIAIALMAYLYAAKQKSNRILEFSQKEINCQNKKLTDLLQEKEWLMKEIHHRVKNNLQIISSLLNSQLSFLNNNQAIDAIRDSQNRIQAISIVHQKLYQSEDLAKVNMKHYIEDLSLSISESFQRNQHISYFFEINNISLDTSVTVPLGLILNEAITNSIKYAFEPGRSGTISIYLRLQADGWYELTVKDNGIGLPSGFRTEACASLGMNLIMGLTNQLYGTFDIRSENGVIVTIRFPENSEQMDL